MCVFTTRLRTIASLALLIFLGLWLGCQPVAREEGPVVTAGPTVAHTPTATPSSAPTTVPTLTPTPTPIPTPVPTFLPATPDPAVRLRSVLTEEGPGLYRNTKTEEHLRFGSFGEEPPGFYVTEPEAEPVYGAPVQPLEGLALSPYAPENRPRKDGDRWLTVYLGSQSVVCFLAQDGDWVVERIMICSAADAKHNTPMGQHFIYSKYTYKAMTRMNGIMVYAQYACRFRGHYLFHTVPIGGAHRNSQKYGRKQMLISEYEMMGSPASHGCVRLLVGDAYWIYTNCQMGTKVLVTTDVGPAPPPAPALIYQEPYMNADQTLGWDPTDPDEENPYRAVYPEWFEDL